MLPCSRMGCFQLPYRFVLREGILMRAHVEWSFVGLSDRLLSGSWSKYLGKAFMLLCIVEFCGSEEIMLILRLPNFVYSPYGHSLMKTLLVCHVSDLFTVGCDTERARPYILAFQEFMMCLCMAINVAGSNWVLLLFDCYVMSASKEELRLLFFFFIFIFPVCCLPSLST